MVTARPRSVLSPVIPRATKPKAPTKAELNAQAEEWRSRPTEPGPFGEEPTHYGTEAEVRALAELDAAAGLAPVVELRISGAGWFAHPRPRVYVQDLATLHLARNDGTNRWEILPAGQELINESLGL